VSGEAELLDGVHDDGALTVPASGYRDGDARYVHAALLLASVRYGRQQALSFQVRRTFPFTAHNKILKDSGYGGPVRRDVPEA
jgi:hypothetical protein